MPKPLDKIGLSDPKVKRIVLPVAGAALAYVAYRYMTRSTTETVPTIVDAVGPTVGTNAQDAGTSRVDENTNAAWSKRAVESLVAVGWDAGTASQAIGVYLSEGVLTSNQADAVRQAIALEGRPPVGSFSINTTVTTPVTQVPTTPAGPVNSTPVSAPTASWGSTRPVLRVGSKGAVVKEWQQDLINVGFKPGTVDGIFGAKTLAATRSFQKARGLSADGIVGPKTWQSMHG